MGFARGPKIVTDGLVIVADPSSDRSYTSGSSTIFNLIVNGKDGTIGSSIDYNEENSGTLEFAGVGNSSNWIQFGVGTDYFPVPNLTMETWFKSSEMGSGQTIGGFWSLTFGVTQWINSNGTVACRCSESGSGVLNRTLTSTGTYLDGEWHHYVYTLSDAGEMIMYLDGELENSRSDAIWSGSTIWPTIQMEYGIERNNSASRSLSGSMGVARFYDRVLSADEVLQNYNAQKSRFGKE